MQSLDFGVYVDNGQNEPAFKLEVNTRTGAVIALVLRDRETGDALARVHIPPAAANSLGQAISLAGTMKLTEQG